MGARVTTLAHGRTFVYRNTGSAHGLLIADTGLSTRCLFCHVLLANGTATLELWLQFSMQYVPNVLSIELLNIELLKLNYHKKGVHHVITRLLLMALR